MSSINGTDLTIVSFSDKSIIVNFKYNDIYFDIETMNVAQEELVDVLESIIK